MRQSDNCLPGNLPYLGCTSVPSSGGMMKQWQRMFVVHLLNQFVQTAVFTLGSELMQQRSQSEGNRRDDENQQLTEPFHQK